MKLLRITLLAKDLAALQAFYREKLGIKVRASSDQQVTFEIGESQLIFDKASDNWRGFYHFAINIPRNQFAEAKTWLSALVTLAKTPEGADTVHSDSWQSDSLYFYDPAGNIVELIARHTLENDSAMSFGPQSLLNISEIGIVTNHVADTVETFVNVLHTSVYDDGGAGSAAKFCAVGDENGLFIVVEEGRRWLPDLTQAADYFRIQMLVENNEGHHFELDIPPALFDKH